MPSSIHNTDTIETALREVLSRHPGIRLAILFGSLASGRENPESDVDIAIDLGRSLDAETKMELMEQLAERTGRPIDLIDLQTAGTLLLGQILKHGKRLLGNDRPHAELIKRQIFDEADFMPYYRRILEERRNSWIAN